MSAPIVDIVDRDNHPLGFRANVEHATRYGQWFRGVHIVLYTRDGFVLVERRSHRIVFHPDQLDISLGGIVDAGEKPEVTAERELYEELGLQIHASQLEFISLNRYNHRWPSYHKRTRNIIYHYLIEIPDRYAPLQLQRSEVAEAHFLTLRETWRLIHRRRLAQFGRLEPKYAMYSHLLEQVEQRLAKKPKTAGSV